MEKIEFNEAVAGWARLVKSKMIQRVATLTLKDKNTIRRRQARKTKGEKPLTRSIGFGFKKSAGDIDRISFRMLTHGIFFDRGVGRSRGAGSTGARPNPFIAESIDPSIEKLADIIVEYQADVAAAEIKFSLPGIANSRIKIVKNG